MVYTSGFWADLETDTLEMAQDRKMQMVCEKLHMKPGDRHLDIGCGWGTLVTYSAKHFGAQSTGVTIAQEGHDWAVKQIADHGMTGKAKILRIDYRDIPKQKFDKITCLEMGEHVGIRKFQRFINQIYDLLADDGKFYIQQAGLRANPGIFTAGPHWEDLIWGLYMNEYIFSGADASTPLAFLTNSLQNANFEVNTVENLGIHYSHTIHKWYYNWIENEEQINGSYGVWWFRMWQLFLRWSVDIAAQGSSTCWGIIAHKNLNQTDRDAYIGRLNLGERASELAVPTTL
jgi:cyclopropane fatty-acyl-phospholipid synthase-like methyltransferase